MDDRFPTGETRSCIKCGREVGPDESICRICNRAGMATPSATQYHGTIVVAIVVAVAGLAWAASASLEGVGPYTAEVREVAAADLGYDIAYAVTNEGSKAGRAKCQLAALTAAGRTLRTVNTLTVQIAGGSTVAETASIPGLEAEPDEVRVRCS
ncbi:MAG TPA: hypothetical protein VM253_10895 [Candidatus Limnocylindrales bacterium]|jgi:RNA polymerase subunit RPABC4/transcription elongation factor Spt4|nr:hypothetical protein [Candidatus Limnocylindrales bacterium]